MNTLTDARRNLAANFRAVNVSTAIEPGSGRLLPAPEALARWLGQYHAAYFDANEEVNAGELHRLQGRSLSLGGDHLLTAVEDVVAMSTAALRCGMSTSVILSVAALAAYPHAVAALRAAAPGLQYRIDCTSLTAASSPQALAGCRAILAEQVGAGGSLWLIGDVAPLRATGMFEDVPFNQAFITILPRRAGGIRVVNRPHASTPCHDFIAWHVDELGDIYPCAGMLRHKPARFGSIHEPFARLVDALAYTERSIEELARRGPRIADEDARFPADLCALHRQSVHGLATL